MCVPLVSESKDEILQVTMVRCADDKVPPARSSCLAKRSRSRGRTRCSITSVAIAEALVSNGGRVIIYSDLVKHQLRRRTSCELNALALGSQPTTSCLRLASSRQKCAITAPNIDDTPCVQLRGQPDDMLPQVCFYMRRLRAAVVIVLQMVPGCRVALHRRHRRPATEQPEVQGMH